jgi:hypothetical protein
MKTALCSSIPVRSIQVVSSLCVEWMLPSTQSLVLKDDPTPKREEAAPRASKSLPGTPERLETKKKSGR